MINNIFGKLNRKNKIWIFITAAFFTLGLNLLIHLTGLDARLGNVMDNFYEKQSPAFIVFYTVIVSPVLEELVFRGALYGVLTYFEKKSFMRYLKYVIVSLAFAIYHGNILQGIYAFVFSFLLIYTMECYESLIAAMLMHAFSNLVAVIFTLTGLIYFIQKSFLLSLALMLLSFSVSALCIIEMKKP